MIRPYVITDQEELSLEAFLAAMGAKSIEYDRDLVAKAYDYCKSFHDGQYRKSGEPYFVHPVNVAFILIELNMDQDAIIAGLLHDVLEDTKVTHDEMVEAFGQEITYLVDGVTKITNMPFKNKIESQAENVRKMIMAMSNDIRVIIVKLADRLHNMRTLEHMPKHKQYEKSKETLELYVPLANRLGISKVKAELEDLAFYFLDPEDFLDIRNKVNMRNEERQAYLNKVMAQIRDEMAKMGINDPIITGRPKSIYSIFSKMTKQDKTFEEIYDLLGMRIIVDTVDECYTVLGIVHRLWKPISGRFKDYIAVPKANMYQSIHSTVVGPEGKVFEVQIRTKEMHRTAEYGIAAHWQYKEGGRADKTNEKLQWLRMLTEWQKDLKDPEEFMDALKEDFFSDEVYVFSPKGDVVGLAAGSVPIDFAYRVHTAVGNKCVGAKVNGKMVPLDTELKNGDIVEIITSANSKGPSKDWIDIVQSSSTRQKIRQYFKKTNRSENIANGKNMLEKEVSSQGFRLSEMLKESWIEEIAEEMSLTSTDDMYAALGYGSIQLTQILSKLKRRYREYYKPQATIEEITREANERAKPTSVNGIIIEGIDNIQVKTANCCNPVPGDDIIGYITKGSGLSVHRADCPNLDNLDMDRTIKVHWDSDTDALFDLEVFVHAYDRVSYMTEITDKIGSMNINIENLSARRNADNTFDIEMILAINVKDDVEAILSSIKQVEGTIDAYRVKR